MGRPRLRGGSRRCACGWPRAQPGLPPPQAGLRASAASTRTRPLWGRGRGSGLEPEAPPSPWGRRPSKPRRRAGPGPQTGAFWHPGPGRGPLAVSKKNAAGIFSASAERQGALEAGSDSRARPGRLPPGRASSQGWCPRHTLREPGQRPRGVPAADRGPSQAGRPPRLPPLPLHLSHWVSPRRRPPLGLKRA